MPLKTCPFCQLDFAQDKIKYHIGVEHLGIHPDRIDDEDEGNTGTESKTRFDKIVKSEAEENSMDTSESEKEFQNDSFSIGIKCASCNVATMVVSQKEAIRKRKEEKETAHLKETHMCVCALHACV